ncbi:MAG: GNAT family N-acetyltransferase [Clostridiales bacterium]|nr:GNAT family N-acetyltransferase [Clostridiales bacterium]
MEVRIATIEEIVAWWDKKIEKQPNNPAYKVWKQNFVDGNKNGSRKTFFVFDKNEYIGQGTLLLKSNDKIMTDKNKAEVIKLEINPEYRGKGIATLIYKAIEKYAKDNNITTLTIGVEPCEVRNIQIYFHWGFTNFLQCIAETFPPREPGGIGETITVLCYSKNI